MRRARAAVLDGLGRSGGDRRRSTTAAPTAASRAWSRCGATSRACASCAWRATTARPRRWRPASTHARGAIIVTMDADLQNDPADIPRLLAALTDEVDVVHGWRARASGPWSARAALPSHHRQPADRRRSPACASTTTAARCGDAGADGAQELQLYGELHRFIPALAADLGARVIELPVPPPAAHRGPLEVRHLAHDARAAGSAHRQVPVRLLDASDPALRPARARVRLLPAAGLTG